MARCVWANNECDELNNNGWRDDDLPTQYATQYIAIVVAAAVATAAVIAVAHIEHFIIFASTFFSSAFISIDWIRWLCR